MVTCLRDSSSLAAMRAPISVLMPVKNGILYLPRAKEMISANCVGSDQIIIIDDCSTDGSYKFLRDWELLDPRVQVIRNPNPGLVNALNLGLLHARYEWVARFDVDDIYSPERLSIQVGAISPNIVAIFSDYSLGNSRFKSFGTIPTGVDADVVALSLCNSQRTPHPSVLFSKSHVLAVGGYRSADFPAEDLSLWLRLVATGNLISISNPILNYQINSHSITKLNQEDMKHRRLELLKEFPIPPEIAISISNRWKFIFVEYRLFPQVGLRRLLLCWDFVKCISCSGRNLGDLKTVLQMIAFLIVRLSTYIGLFQAVRLIIGKRALSD